MAEFVRQQNTQQGGGKRHAQDQQLRLAPQFAEEGEGNVPIKNRKILGVIELDVRAHDQSRQDREQEKPQVKGQRVVPTLAGPEAPADRDPRGSGPRYLADRWLADTPELGFIAHTQVGKNPILARSWPPVNRLGERLQFLAGLEAHSLAGGNTDFRPCSGVPPDTGLARFHIENTEATQFNAVALRQRFLHGFKYRFHGHFRFCLRHACAVDDLIDDVQLYHANLLKMQALILRTQRGIVKNFLLDYDSPLFTCRMGMIPWVAATATNPHFTRGETQCRSRTIAGFVRWPRSTT